MKYTLIIYYFGKTGNFPLLRVNCLINSCLGVYLFRFYFPLFSHFLFIYVIFPLLAMLVVILN